MSTEQAQQALEAAQRALDKINAAHKDIAQAQHELSEMLNSYPVLDCKPAPEFLNDPMGKLMQFYWGFKIGTRKGK